MKNHIWYLGIFCWTFFFVAAEKGHAKIFCPEGTTCPTMSESLSLLAKELFGVGLILSDDINLVILGWIKFLLALVGTIAFAAFVYAGFRYISSFGNEESIEKAKNTIKWTTIGILVILTSYSIVSALISATV